MAVGLEREMRLGDNDVSQLIIVAGASGAGKSFLLQNMRRLEQELSPVKKLTTRRPRPYETEDLQRDLDLKFGCTLDEVTRCDYVYRYGDNWYGTPKINVDKVLAADQNPCLIVRSCETIRKIKKDYPQALVLYVQSGLSGVDLERQLKEQGRHPDDIDERMRRLRQDYFDYCNHIELFDYVLINYFDPDSLVNQMMAVMRIAAEKEHRIRIREDHVFVLMPFHEDYDDVFKAMKAAGRLMNTRKLHVERMDMIHGDYDIVTAIFKYMREAALIVCEVSETNPNVFFELGYARAINKTVVHCAKQGTNLPFDIEHYRNVFYSTPMDLQEKLIVEFKHFFVGQDAC